MTGLLLFFACRPLPGVDNYDDTGFLQPDWSVLDEVSGALEGPDPWDRNTPRLTVHLFYENGTSGASHAIPIDNLSVFYWIYEGTYYHLDTDDRVEGEMADALVHGGGAWWGGGVHFEDGPRDFTPWSLLHISVKSDAVAFEQTTVGMTTQSGQASTLLTDWGFVADDAWHHLKIPMDQVATGLGQTTIPLLLLGGPGTSGDRLLIDNVYWTPEEP